MNLLKINLVFAILLSISSLSFAQYNGPGVAIQSYTVKEIRDNAMKLDRLDKLVKVQGFIIKQINAENFEFRDSTGTIRVEIKRKYMPDKPFNEKTEVILIGEVDHDLLEPTEIEVEEVQILNLE